MKWLVLLRLLQHRHKHTRLYDFWLWIMLLCLEIPCLVDCVKPVIYSLLCRCTQTNPPPHRCIATPLGMKRHAHTPTWTQLFSLLRIFALFFSSPNFFGEPQLYMIYIKQINFHFCPFVSVLAIPFPSSHQAHAPIVFVGWNGPNHLPLPFRYLPLYIF